MRNIIKIVCIFCILSGFIFADKKTDKETDYYPAKSWRTSTPERQGMDSNGLAEMINFIKREKYNISSVVVIRNGYLINDAYFYPFNKKMGHILHSCSKSITSALIGIALYKGIIKGINTSVSEYFPEIKLDNPGKENITIKDILTMSSGLDTRDSYLYGFQGLRSLNQSLNWPDHIFKAPLIATPGTKFEYSNSMTFLLSSILQKRSGVDALEFAKKHLFSYMGIERVNWEKNQKGVCIGWGGITMRPVDMAKFGYLFLKEGRWNKRELVPSSWVRMSISKRIQAGTLSDHYGFQWWVDNYGYYMAMGYGGQYIIVYPKKNLIAVFVSALENHDFFLPEKLFRRFILNSIKSDKKIKQNRKGVIVLSSALKEISEPEKKKVIVPDEALKHSGMTYSLEKNPFGYKSFTLSFTGKNNIMDFIFSYGDKKNKIEIGLDNIFRLVHVNGHWRGFRGEWKDKDRLLLEYKVIDATERGEILIEFEKEKVFLTVSEFISGSRRNFSGNIIKK